MFGKKVGFIKFKANVVDAATKQPLPGIVFMRSDTVAILVVLECEGKEYVVLAVQPRLPTGTFDFVEVLAGMLDDSGSFVGIAAKELSEESGGAFNISENDLIDLGEELGLDTPMFLSPGGSNEAIRFFLYRASVTREFLTSLQGKATGVLKEGEQIKLRVDPFETAHRGYRDAKTLLALMMYRIYTL
jgi:ADP-sugar diphosphatase